MHGNNVNDTIKRLRDQMSRLPTSGISYPFGKIPENANKTSTTKIIDGHIVTINETTYNDDDSNSTFVFKIRTVDIQPENGTDITGFNDGGNNGDNVENVDNSDNGGGEQIEKDKDSKSLDSNNNETTTERSVETVEDPGNNEIPDNQVETLTA
ncbi:hypothetical protein PV325_011901 [Microctonus aethiopoides]|nr:hypothetical protein PV325_011901 [Microctonus aethiopoides]